MMKKLPAARNISLIITAMGLPFVFLSALNTKSFYAWSGGFAYLALIGGQLFVTFLLLFAVDIADDETAADYNARLRWGCPAAILFILVPWIARIMLVNATPWLRAGEALLSASWP